MRFLVSSSTYVDHRFGIMATPSVAQNYAGIEAGMWWAADNEAFAKGFDPDRFLPWLANMEPHKARCLFVTVPDVVGLAPATVEMFELWAPRIQGWPLAYVAQDGAEYLAFPKGCAAVFIGGSTKWKTGPGAVSVIQRAYGAGKHVHNGRVNFWNR